MSGVDIAAAAAGLKEAQLNAFTEECEAAFRATLAELASLAQAKGFTFPDAMSCITTGGQAAVLRTLTRFSSVDSAEELERMAGLAVIELAPRCFEAEIVARSKATSAGNA